MAIRSLRWNGPGWRPWAVTALVAAGMWCGHPAVAQSDKPASGKAASGAVMQLKDAAPTDGGIIQASCASCGGNLAPSGGCSTCGGGAPCYPGHKPCCGCAADSCFGRFFCEFYECVCCPDPCYEPVWVAAANAAFFVDGARPVTQTTLRWDKGLNGVFPDRAEYFWAHVRPCTVVNFKLGPATCIAPNGKTLAPGKGPQLQVPNAQGENGFNYDELHLITEGATGNFSASIDMPYRSVDPDFAAHAAGFGDITIGTKSLLLDCELLQLAFAFKTTLPSGNFGKGLGNGHVSLEPSLLMALKLAEDTYLQAQVSEWIPLGGDPDYMGAILHYHFSINRVLWRPIPDLQLIGTAEAFAFTFQDGLYSDPLLGPSKASGGTYANAGPGLRMVFCDKLDFGVGTAFSFSRHNLADQLFRTELRIRF